MPFIIWLWNNNFLLWYCRCTLYTNYWRNSLQLSPIIYLFWIIRDPILSHLSMDKTFSYKNILWHQHVDPKISYLALLERYQDRSKHDHFQTMFPHWVRNHNLNKKDNADFFQINAIYEDFFHPKTPFTPILSQNREFIFINAWLTYV